MELSFQTLIIFILCGLSYGDVSVEEEPGSGYHVIEGKIFPLSDFVTSNWQANTRIHVNGGEFIGFVRKDGSFVVHNVPTGSYIVEVLHPEYTFETVRVEINSKGKFRARKVNYIQTGLVNQVPYPLRIKAFGKTRYFQLREQWRITDFLFNPMIMMMVLPVFLIMVLPKLMSDPETKRDFEQIQKMTKFDVPQMSDVVSNFLASNTAPAVAKDSVKEKDGRKVQKHRKRAATKE